MQRYVLVHAPGNPSCRLCRGMGVRSVTNRLGLHKPCKCVSPEAMQKFEANVQADNRLNDMLKVKLPPKPA